MHPSSNNVGAYITSKLAMDNISFGAGFGNIAQQAGVGFDRTAKAPLHLSGKVGIGYKATLASGHTASFTYAVQHSDADSGYADLAGASGVTSLTALNSGAAQRGVMELNVDLIGAKKWVNIRLTPVMSHSGTDVIVTNGQWQLGGGETIPPVEVTAAS